MDHLQSPSFTLDKLPPSRDKVYYLASPYSNPNPLLQHMNYLKVTAASAVLMKHGFNLIEPIGASHPVAHMYKLPVGYAYWQERDRALIQHSDGVLVLRMKGWETSVGVADEIAFAITNNIPVFYIDLYDVIAPFDYI